MSDNIKGQIFLKDLLLEPGATGLRSDYKDHTDPKYIGPGTWNLLHRRSFKARNHGEQVSFIEFMKDVCDGFPCTICKGHCTEYIKNHPMEEYLDILVDINGEKIPLGLFVWTWKFHNAVNTRIKKPVMAWETAYNIYSEAEPLICSKNCLEAAGNDQPADGLEFTNQGKNNPQTKEILVNQIQNKVPNIPEFKISPTIQTKPFRLISITRK